MGILSDAEKADLRQLDLDAIVRRFTNKRAKDFNPSSLKEYGRRIRRALDLFLSWRDDPANFTVKTRTTTGPRNKDKELGTDDSITKETSTEKAPDEVAGTYRSAIPIRPGIVVTHLRQLAPLPVEEMRALNRVVAELGGIRRNLNQMARAAHHATPVADPVPADVMTMIRVCEALRVTSRRCSKRTQ